MLTNYSYFLDKTIQTLFLTLALTIMIRNGWSSILSIFLTVLFSLIILDGLQGKTGYIYTYAEAPSVLVRETPTLTQETPIRSPNRINQQTQAATAALDSLSQEIREFRDQLNVGQVKQLVGGSYYHRI